jgi:hypothetical protein
MQRVIPRITLGSNSIDPATVVEFEIDSGFEQILPKGHVKIADQSSKSIAQFWGLSIGTEVTVELYDFEDVTNTPIIKYPQKGPKFVILKVTDDDAYNPSKLAGDIVVEFGHPWYLFKDATNHAYPQKNYTELIKMILKDDKGRGFALPAEDKFFAKTDDTGRQNKYKCGTTDYDFIMNQVLPFCTNGQLPMYFFCDDYGNFTLKNFPLLYKEKATILLRPNDQDMSDPNSLKAIKDIGNEVGLKTDDVVFPIAGAKLSIGGRDVAEAMMVNWAAESTATASYANGAKLIGSKLTPRSGKNFGNILPIDLVAMGKLSGTSYKIAKNRPLTDAMSLVFASAKPLDSIISLTLSAGYVGEKITTGGTAYVAFPMLAYGETETYGEKIAKSPWMNGKWVVAGLRHKYEISSSSIKSNLDLWRPSFVGNEKSTSLLMYGLMWEAV